MTGMLTRPLSAMDLKKLRENDLLEHDEFAFIAGDVIIAENVVSKARRVINVGNLLLESNRRVLRD